MSQSLRNSDSTDRISAERMRLVALLADFANRNPTRRADATRIIELIAGAARAAYRDNFHPGHLTGSAWVVDPKTAKVLLLHHAKLNRWLQPGGHADGEYDLAAVALREAREESGLTSLVLASPDIFDIDIHPIPERGHEPAHEHFDVRFMIIASSDELPTISEESHAAEWFSRDTLAGFISDGSVLRMAQNWRG
jgi:8-oxo-dGTP pyrophosphatase MutT (NUDIX family)